MSSEQHGSEDGAAPLRLGGMALQNGLFLHGPTSWSAAVRDSGGAIRVASGRKRELPEGVTKLPFARGVVRVAELLALLPTVRRALPQARLPFAQPRVFVTAALSAALAAKLRSSRLSPARAELLSALAGIVPSAMALRSRTLAQYHGAEHKTIGAYETGSSAEDATKEHERCGSHLIGPLLLATTAANALAAYAPARSRQAARAGGSLAAMGAAVEIFGWMDRNRGSALSRALARPGHALQRFASTAEPDAAQLEVAGRALDELLRLEGDAPR
jgi:uncharacterized protein YqhQ